MTRAPIAIIGGSGMEDAFDELSERRVVTTPYGETSAPIATGLLGGREVVYLPRHGEAHRLPPHRVPYRANAWALASLGVRGIVSTAAVGSIDPRLGPETICLADQLLDRTRSRTGTFFDEPGDVEHLPLRDPFCRELQQLARDEGITTTATVGVIDGPRFSTRAESRELAAAGVQLVNMTLCPEVALAAELGIGTVTLCLVTDTDTGQHDSDPDAVTAELVFRRMASARPRLIAAVSAIAQNVPDDYAGRALLGEDARRRVLSRAVS